MGRAGQIATLACILLLSLSCSKTNPVDCFKNSGKVVVEKREITSFTYLHMKNNVDVYLSFSPEYSVEVKAGENMIPGIKTSISGKKLTISNENSCNWIRSYSSPIEVHLGVPVLDSVLYQSSGNLSSVNQLSGNSFKLDVEDGAGSINLWLNMHRSKINLHYGTTDLILRGHAHISQLFSGAYGPADLSQLQTEISYVTNNSTNICRVQADITLEVEIHNVGDVYYSGDPNTVALWATGSGELIKE
ncbi:MAG: DUF2807 domain-containing protein [Bacteroidota bacterium]